MELPKIRIRKPLETLENKLLISTSLFFAVISSFFFMKGQKMSLVATISFERIYLAYGIVFLFLIVILAYVFRNPISFLSFAKKILLVFLPTEIILFSAFFSHSDRFKTVLLNYEIRMLVYAYLIATCFYLLFLYKKYRRPADFFHDLFGSKREEKTEKISLSKRLSLWVKDQGAVTLFIVLAVMSLNIAFASFHLSEFAAVDEPLWTYGRIPKFWNNVSDGEFQKTMISDKPGITVAILSGTGLFFEDPLQYESASKEELSSKGMDIRDMNFALRLPIALFCSLMLLAFYFLIKKLLGKTTALLSLIFIGLSPILIGISTIINPDALLWVFMPLSMISYFIYLKNHQGRFLYLSGMFLGLAILTKYVANILYIFFFGIIFLEYIMNQEKYREEGISNYLRRTLPDYLILVFFSLLTFFLLLPAAWINISRLFEGTIYSKAFIKIWPLFIAIIATIIIDMLLWKNKLTGKILDFLARYRACFIIIPSCIFLAFTALTLAVTYSGMKIYDLEAILASPKTSYLSGGFSALMSANFYSLVFGIIPLSFLGIITSIIYAIKNSRKNNPNIVWSTYIIIFILLYYFASTISNVSATVRYQIVIYPLALIISALGINYLITSEKIKRYLVPNATFLIIILVSLYSLNFIKPFYFSYASDLLPKQYVLNIKDMGDGSFEAAQYLNSLPNAQKLIVWTDKRGVCTFFRGECHSGFDFDKSKISFDYFVISSGRENRTTKMTLSRVNGGNTTLFRLDKLYELQNPEFEIKIGERPNNFVKVISSKNAIN